MKKIEAVINRTALEAVKLHLAEVGIERRLTVTEVKGVETVGRFDKTRKIASEDQWQRCLHPPNQVSANAGRGYGNS